MAQLVLSKGKFEYVDNDKNYQTLASENWVINTINYISPVNLSTTNDLIATYNNGSSGIGATLTNSGIKTTLIIDGVSTNVGDRVLVTKQTSAFQNGIYIVTDKGSVTTNWVLTRSIDFDTPIQIKQGDIISAISGTVNAATLWMLTSNVSTIGTDNISFSAVDRSSFSSIIGTTDQISVNITNGVATLSLPTNIVTPGKLTVSGDLLVNSTGSVKMAAGTTSERTVNPDVGYIRFNKDL